jgi:CBS domain-containing protein
MFHKIIDKNQLCPLIGHKAISFVLQLLYNRKKHIIYSNSRIMKVKEVMTTDALQYCTPETRLQEAAKAMKANNCGALPVVDKDKKVLGIITDRDICLSLAQKQEAPLADRKVSEVMTRNVQTVESDDELSAVYHRMRKNQIGRLPVVDDKGKLKGIVSLHKLINKHVHEGKKELGDINAPGENLMKTIPAVTDRYTGTKEAATRLYSTL